LQPQGLTKHRERHPVLGEIELLLDGDLRLQVEDPYEKFAELPPLGGPDQGPELPILADDPQDIEWAESSGEEMMAGPGERLGGW
jgi:hypothetical protein